MDIKRDDWFGQMKMSGVAKPVDGQGSILAMVGEFLTQLRTLNPRDLADGKQITITFSTNPIGGNKLQDQRQQLVHEVTESLALSKSHVDDGPAADESIDSFVNRLIASGHSSASARFIACDWYGIEDAEGTERLAAWLEDPKAIRFRHLNSSSSAYESAHPTEYRGLVDDMRERFPEFIETLVLRIAI